MKSRLMLLAICLLYCGSVLSQAPSWRTLEGPFSGGGRHDDVFFINENLGWIANGSGEVHKTTDGGQSWTQMLSRPEYLRSIGFANELRGWVGTLDSADVLFETTDGGVIWTEVENITGPPPDGICGIWVVNDSVVFASGEYNGPARIIRTTNGGLTWTSMSVDSLAGALVDCYFVNADTGFAVGSNNGNYQQGSSRILRTVDGGETWQVVFAGTRIGELCWKISFPTRSVGYVSIERFGAGPTNFLKTTDGGTTWEGKLFQPTRFDVQGIGFVSPTHGWIGGWNMPPYRTTDGGDTWSVSAFGSNLNRIRFLNDTLGYAVGSGTYKYSPDSTTEVQANTEIPFEVALHQNYPNPFNPSTTIDYSLSRTTAVEIKILDVLGRTVKNLVHGDQSAGNFSIVWDGKDNSGREVSSGVFLCRLTAGNNKLTQRMLLLR